MERFARKIKYIIGFFVSLCFINTVFFVSDSFADKFEENQEKFIYTNDNRPDPFLPLLTSKGVVQEAGPSIREEMMTHLGKIKVNGILWDEEMPIVMINNKMRKEGDIVENLTIKEINVNGVIFGYHDLTHEIVLIKKKKLYDQGGF